jgi:hypothetical protein
MSSRKAVLQFWQFLRKAVLQFWQFLRNSREEFAWIPHVALLLAMNRSLRYYKKMILLRRDRIWSKSIKMTFPVLERRTIANREINSIFL